MALQPKLSVLGRPRFGVSTAKTVRDMTTILFSSYRPMHGPPQTTHGIFIRRLEKFLRACELREVHIQIFYTSKNMKINMIYPYFT